MAAKSTLSKLQNIGATVETRLNEIGVYDLNGLRKLGPVVAYRKMKLKSPNSTLPRCYYLYSLEGAIRGVHWNELSEAVKKRLSLDAGFPD